MFNARRRDFLNNTVIGDAHELHMVRTNPRYTEYENDYSQQEILLILRLLLHFATSFVTVFLYKATPYQRNPRNTSRLHE